MQLDGLTALIINPDIGSRSRLREVIKSAVYKVSLSWVQSFREAADKGDALSNFDVVMLSIKLGQDNVREFITSIKGSAKGPIPTFVVTLEGQTHDMVTKVSSLYLDGVQGFITEPYSADDLISLLSTVQTKREEMDQTAKQRKALQFLFQESIRCIDVLVKCYSVEKKPTSGIVKEAKNLAASTAALYAQNPEVYAATMIEVFEKIPPPKVHAELRRRKTVKKLLLHPGRIISDLMHERQLTVERLQASMKVDVAQFQSFLDCKCPLDDALSRELSRLFGRTAREWLKLQKEYDFQQQLEAGKESAEEPPDN